MDKALSNIRIIEIIEPIAPRLSRRIASQPGRSLTRLNSRHGDRIRLARRSQQGCIRLQSEENPAGRLQDARIDPDMLGDSVYVSERPLKRATRV
jgi:hypothetical protein